MNKLMNVLTSQVGRKILTALTGLGLSAFVLIHLLGNLQLFVSAEAFNGYTYKLESTAPLLYIIELGLLFVFALHAVVGVSIYLKKKQARNSEYQVYNSAGKPSRQTSSSRSMIVTGSVLLLFTIFHIASIKFGPGIKEGYVTTVNGVEMRDLYRLVIETFQNELYVSGYVFATILLGFHLRHGVWSAFQSLGAMNKNYTSLIYTAGVIFAVFISAGFLVLPVWIYFSF